MTHPLTDEICREVADSMIDFPNGFPDAHDHMRAGADWQLEELKRKVALKLTKWQISGCVDVDACEDFFEEIMQELRPSTKENNQ